MKKIVLTIITFAIVVVTVAQEKVEEKMSISLSEAINLGLEQNFDQQIMEISRLSAEEDLAQSKRDLLPDLNAQASQGISNVNQTGNYSLNASATIWSGGAKTNAIRRSKIELEQVDEQIIQAQNSLAMSIINTFLSAVMNEELYRHQESILRISEEQAELGKVRYQTGEILESDYLLLKAQAASDANSLTNSRIERDNAIIELKSLLFIDNSIELEVINPNMDQSLGTMTLPSLTEFVDITMAWLPDLKIARSSVEIAQSNIDIAKAAFMPTLSVNGSVGTGYNNTYNQSWGSQFVGNNVNSINLSLNIPIWNKGKTRSNVKQMTYVAEQTEIEAEKVEFELRNSLEREYNNTYALQLRTFAAEETYRAYEETFRVFSTQFTEGAISTTELLQQQNNYLTSLNTYVQSKYSYILSRKILDVYMGLEIKL